MIQSLLFPFGRPKIINGPRYGDMYERGVAAAIDLTLIYTLLNNLVFVPLTQTIYAYGNQELLKSVAPDIKIGEFLQIMWQAHMVHLWLLNCALQMTLVGIFMVGFQIVYQTTPGKWLLGLKVVRHGVDAPLSGWRYTLRFISYFIACAPLMLGMIWMMFNKQRRGWHDYISGTVVINTRPYGWYYQKLKQVFLWLRLKLTSARQIEQPMAEPSSEKRHEDSDKPV